MLGMVGSHLVSCLSFFAANSCSRWVVCGEAKREAAPRAGAGQRPGVEDNGGLWPVRRFGYALDGVGL